MQIQVESRPRPASLGSTSSRPVSHPSGLASPPSCGCVANRAAGFASRSRARMLSLGLQLARELACCPVGARVAGKSSCRIYLQHHMLTFSRLLARLADKAASCASPTGWQSGLASPPAHDCLASQRSALAFARAATCKPVSSRPCTFFAARFACTPDRVRKSTENRPASKSVSSCQPVSSCKPSLRSKPAQRICKLPTSALTAVMSDLQVRCADLLASRGLTGLPAFSRATCKSAALTCGAAVS